MRLQEIYLTKHNFFIYMNYIMSYYKLFIKYKNKYLKLKNTLYGGNLNRPLKIHIFLLCLNEEVMLPKTISHYKRIFPNCEITIADNGSTDESINIAKNLGCHIHSWTYDKIENLMMKGTEIRDNIWKTSSADWIIMCDMDEFLCMTYKDLENEDTQDTTIISTIGYEIFGDSQNEYLNDLDITTLTSGIQSNFFNKPICFKRTSIVNINYIPGAHSANPVGVIKYSKKKYPLYHFNFLGLPWYIKKHIRRAQQKDKQKYSHGTSYYDKEVLRIKNYYNNVNKTYNIIKITSLYEYYNSSLK